jgi:hypothetical protein
VVARRDGGACVLQEWVRRARRREKKEEMRGRQRERQTNRQRRGWGMDDPFVPHPMYH